MVSKLYRYKSDWGATSKIISAQAEPCTPPFSISPSALNEIASAIIFLQF